MQGRTGRGLGNDVFPRTPVIGEGRDANRGAIQALDSLKVEPSSRTPQSNTSHPSTWALPAVQPCETDMSPTLSGIVLTWGSVRLNELNTR